MEGQNNKLNNALYKLLRPLARLCLHFGFGYREYCELSKTAFVSVAAEDYGVHGRPTNASRIAAMTGLTRKEISRLRKCIDRGEAVQAGRGTPIREILKAWQNENEFLDSDGRARVLPLDGKRGSFRSLVKQFAGDIPEGAMRTELERKGAAELNKDEMRLIPKDESEVAAATDAACTVLEKAESRLNTIASSVNP